MKAEGYSIKDLEVLSGVKAHTIRIWGKRYGLLSPNRTDTLNNNILYSDIQPTPGLESGVVHQSPVPQAPLEVIHI